MSRLGLVVHGQPPELVGGTERLVADLARDLAAAGETVEVFSGSIEWRPGFEVVRDESGPVPVTRVHRHDLFFERWDKLQDPFVERAYRDWLEAFQPDLVHVHHWARLTTDLVQLAAAHGVPAVVSLHDLFSSCPRYHRVKQDLSFCEERPSPAACLHCAPRWAFQGDAEISASLEVFAADMAAELDAAAALVAPTAGHGRRVTAWLGLERDVLALPPAGSNLSAPATRPLGDRLAGPDEPLRVGVFGHLHPLKGVPVLLQALAHTRHVQLHVWGEAPDDATRAELDAAATGRPVVWHGAYRPQDLAGAPLDVVALPTLCAESYAFTLDEAASLAVPIVASDLGALADRATGRVQLVPRGDARAFAAALDGLAADPARRQAMVAAPAPTSVDGSAHLTALRQVYADVLAGPRPERRPRDDAQLARREHAFLLREAGLGELLRSEGWEAVIAGLEQRIAGLQEQLARRGG